MTGVLKIILFLIILSLVAIAGYVCYKKLNAKITASESLGRLILYSLLLIGANIILLFGGVLLLLKCYELFFSPGTQTT